MIYFDIRVYNVDICKEKVGYIHNLSWKSGGTG